MPTNSSYSVPSNSENPPNADQPGSEGNSQSRHDLWQTATWFIVLLLTLPLISDTNIGISPVPQVIAILLVLFVLAGFVWLFHVIKGGTRKLVTSLDLSLAIIWLALLLTSFLSLDPSRSWRSSAYSTVLIVAFYIIVVAVRFGWRPVNLIRAYLIVLVIYIVMGYMQVGRWLALNSDSGSSLQLGKPLIRVAGLSNNPNTFAALMAVGVVFAMASYLDQRWKRRWLLLVWLIAAAPIVILHGSRNGWLATAIGLSSLLLFCQLRRFSPDLPPRRTWLRLTGFLVIALVISLVLVLLLRPSVANPLSSTGYENRSIFWRVAVETWIENVLTGQGPGTFASAFLKSVSVPFEPLFVSAHSFWFDALAEMGLVGLVSFAFLVWTTVRLVIRSLKAGSWTLDTPGLLAALATIGSFSLLDTPWNHLKLLAIILLAAFVGQVESASSLPEEYPGWKKRLPLIWLPIWAALVFVGVIGWLSANDYGQGVAAAGEAQWQEALAEFDSAADWIPYPDSSLLLAKGFAGGVLAASEDSYLPAAIAAYESLVELEPGWSLNWANLAALRWQAGSQEEAFAAMEEAIERAPDVPLYQLNLAVWLEQAEEADRAVTAYRKLLALDPNLSNEHFWSTSAARQEAHTASGIAWVESQIRDQSSEPDVSTAEQDQTQETADSQDAALAGNSIYGFGQSKRSTYLRDVFVRFDLPTELLPQLQCPATGTNNLLIQQQLTTSRELNGTQTALVDPQNDTQDGLVPCLQPEMHIPQTAD